MAIRVAGVEVGHWHALYDAAYLHHLRGLPGVELVAVQDSDETLAAKRAAEVGSPPPFTDYRKMLAETKPDFVMALGRHSEMARIARDLLDLGFPFLMEKPMGISAAEVESVVERCEAVNGFAAVPLPLRYTEFAQWARRLVADGEFGPISHVSLRMIRPGWARYPRWDSGWLLDPDFAGGGSLRNLGPHVFDLFHFITGEEAQVTAAQMSRQAGAERIEDYALVSLRSCGGISGTIEVGNTLPTEPQGIEGTWVVSGRDAYLEQHRTDMRLISADGYQSLSPEADRPIYRDFIRETLDCWQRGDSPPASARDCLRTAELIDQAYRCATQLP